MFWKLIGAIKGLRARESHTTQPDGDKDLPPIPKTTFPKLDSDDWQFVNSLLKFYGRPLEHYIVGLRDNSLVETTYVQRIIREYHQQCILSMFEKMRIDGVQPSIEITFQGIDKRIVPSIVQYNFRLPWYSGVNGCRPRLANVGKWVRGCISPKISKYYGKETIIVCSMIVGRRYKCIDSHGNCLKIAVEGHASY